MEALPIETSVRTRRVLFVDDEVRILDGLRRLVRGRLPGWEPVFAEGGPAALQLLAASTFDAVVSDLRMPGVDGRQVLEAARVRSPATLRIALTGHTELAVAVETLKLAHQLLVKPCNLEVLLRALSAPFDAERGVRDDRIRALLGRADALPELPAVCRELNALLARNRVDMREVAAVIERDVTLSARVLRLVSSPYFGLSGRVQTLGHAVQLLGLDAVRGMVTSSAAFQSVRPTHIPGLDLEGIERHGLQTARLAGAIARSDSRMGQGLFMAALMHDIGLLLLATHLPEEATRVAKRASAEGVTFFEAEQLERSVGHAALGACLLARWGMPPAVVEAVAHHHAPPPVEDREPAPLDALFLADRLLQRAPDKPLELPEGYLAALGLEASLPSLRALALDAPAEVDHE